MKRKIVSPKDMLSSCDAVGPDDGLDPRYDLRTTSEIKIDRKVLQLCREVARTLNYALAWEMGDDLLSQLQVVSVVPAPNAGRLVVTVTLPGPPGTLQPEQVLEHLRRATGRLRAEVAAAVRRRRVPELAFRVQV